MIALDTNIWVLRAFYHFEAVDIIRVFEHLLGLVNVNVEDSGRVTSTLDLLHAVVLLPRANHGFDFNPTGTSSQQIQPYVGAFLKRFLWGDPSMLSDRSSVDASHCTVVTGRGR